MRWTVRTCLFSLILLGSNIWGLGQPTTPCGPKSFDVKIETGTGDGGGTDSNIRMQLCNSSDSCSNYITLNPLISGNAFESGRTDHFTLNVDFCGVPAYINLISDGGVGGQLLGMLGTSAGDDTWNLKHVEIDGRWFNAGIPRGEGSWLYKNKVARINGPPPPPPTPVTTQAPPRPTYQPPAQPTVLPGTLAGTVLVAGSTPVASATVLLQNLTTGAAANIRTNGQGYWQANMPPGQYRIVVRKPGFQDYTLDNVGLTSQQTVNLTQQLQIYRDAQGNTILHTAFRNRDNQGIESAISQGININEANNQGETILHQATQSGDLQMIEYLLQRGADPNRTNHQGLSPVLMAVSNPQLFSVLEMFIGRGLIDVRQTSFIDRAFDSNNLAALDPLLRNGGNSSYAATKAELVGNENTFNVIAQNFPIQLGNEFFEGALSRNHQSMALTSLNYGVDSNFALSSAIKYNAAQLIEPILGKGAQPDPALTYAVNTGDFRLAEMTLTQYRASPNLGLGLAVEKNNLNLAQIALTVGADANTAMPSAAYQGSEQMVAMLLSNNAAPDPGVVPSAQRGHSRVTLMLIDAGGNPDPALALAISQGNPNFVSELLRRNARAAQAGLMAMAVDGKNRQIVDMMLAAGGNFNEGLSAAVNGNNAELTQVMLNAGANATPPELMAKAVTNKNRQITEMLLAGGGDANAGMSPAVAGNSFELTQLLLEKGADGSRDEYMQTASKIGNRDLVGLLLAAGGNPHAGIMEAVSNGHVPVTELLLQADPPCLEPGCTKLLPVAAQRNDTAITRMLLDVGGQPQVGIWPAIQAGADGTLQLLINAGGDVSEPEYITFAVHRSKVNLIQILADAGAPLDDTGKDGQPLLHWAVTKWNAPLVKAMLDAGADANAVDNVGNSALHILAQDKASPGYPAFEKGERQRMPVLELLLAAGADVNVVNDLTQTPLKVAEGGNVKDTLKNAGALNKVTVAPRTCDSTIILFANSKYQGQQLQLQNSVEDLKGQKFNKKASSLCIPDGWTLVLFDRPGFEGNFVEIVGPTTIEDLKNQRPGGQSWGDRANSVKVLRTNR